MEENTGSAPAGESPQYGGAGGKSGPGPFGDGALQPGKSNINLFAKAIAQGWPIPPEYKTLAINQLMLIIGKSKSQRNKIAAVKALAALDSLNTRREQTESEAERQAGAPANFNIALASVRQELISDPEYLQYLRTRSQDGDAGSVRALSQSGEVDDAAPPTPAGQGDHGHDHGTGGNPQPAGDDAPPARQE